MKILMTFIVLLVSSSVVSFAGDKRYFAELDKDNVVKRVIVCDSLEWVTSKLGGTWVETKRGDVLKRYASKKYKYYVDKTDFSTPKPYDSWTLGADLKWVPPTVKPISDTPMIWNEKTLSWESIQIPTLVEEK